MNYESCVPSVVTPWFHLVLRPTPARRGGSYRPTSFSFSFSSSSSPSSSVSFSFSFSFSISFSTKCQINDPLCALHASVVSPSKRSAGKHSCISGQTSRPSPKTRPQGSKQKPTNFPNESTN